MIFLAPCMKKLSQCMVFFSSFCSFTPTRIMGSVVGELQITYTIYSQDSCLKNCPLAVDVKYLALSNTKKTVYSLFIFATNWKVLNPLSPNIHKQIPQTDLYIFPYGISWEKLIKDQRFFSLWSLINSHRCYTWQSMDIVRRKLMLVTIGTWRVLTK